METDLLKWFAECGHEICGWPEWRVGARFLRLRHEVLPALVCWVLEYRIHDGTGWVYLHGVGDHEALCIIKHHLLTWGRARGACLARNRLGFWTVTLPDGREIVCQDYHAALVAAAEAAQEKADG